MGSPRDASVELFPEAQELRDASAQRKMDDDELEIAKHYQIQEKIGEGTYGMVYKALCRATREMVAIKKIRILQDDDGVPSTALREIALLSDLSHVNVIKLLDVYSTSRNLQLVFECLDMDLRVYLKRFGPFRDAALRRASCQCFAGIEFCHGRGVLHRDLKPQNVLVDVKSMRLVLADFGLARAFSCPLKVYTHEVVTLWYRAPEILLGQVRYGPPMDIWSMGCILAEMATGQALFPGDSEIDTIFKIFQTLGTPTEEVWPGVMTLKDMKEKFPKWPGTNLEEVRHKAGNSLDDDGVDLLKQCLRYNMVDRPSAKRVVRMPFYQGFNDCDDMTPHPPMMQQQQHRSAEAFTSRLLQAQHATSRILQAHAL